jgi:2-oxo-4-hydroxy-4-carboxy--5-ureidoimidazoline (OHCU) decarboxylase
MRDLPRKLSADELAGLFEGDTELVRRLADVDDPLQRAAEVIRGLDQAEKLEALDAHPAIGATGLSARSSAEQGSDEEPEAMAELARLNREYEARHGFRFVVFVDRRPKREILEVLRSRLPRTREEELDTALEELVAIARDRWRRG